MNITTVSGKKASRIVLGCMRMAQLEAKGAQELLESALDAGINCFDHADIYGKGRSEEVFAEALATRPAKREDLSIQSKCAIREGFFDFSKEHILASVDASLKRLGTDYLDALLLHRPDTLMEPEEVAEAFDALERSGKVRHFGVSNHRANQIELLRTAVKQPLIFNQLQFGLMRTGMIDAGLNVNMKNEASYDHDGGILEYSRLKGMTIQAWSPFQYGFFEGVFLGNSKFPQLNGKLDDMAREFGVNASAVALAWILRHPAEMQAIIGTTKAHRVREMGEAAKVELSRQQWYELYRAAGNTLP